MKKFSKRIYLDYAASATPNPSSIHLSGVEEKNKLQDARRRVADILGARPGEVIFTSGGTESNNLAIQGVVLAWHKKSKDKILPHIIMTNIEHPSALETGKMLAQRKLAEVSVVPVEAIGIVDPKKIKKAFRPSTVLVSVMYANNEIGTIQPIKEIAREIRHYKKSRAKSLAPSAYPIFHTDAVQAANYLDLNVEKLGVDLLSLSGSKIEGAGRVGVLYKKRIVLLENIFGGGDQEMGLRPGTENLPEILKFSNALQSVQKTKEKETKRLIRLRDYFINKLQHSDILKNVGMFFNGDLENRLPNSVNITIPKIPSDLLVIELSARGIMVSSKSACESSKPGGSYVIKAIHSELDSEIGGLRFSMGQRTTRKNIDYTVKTLSEILTKLKKWYN
ncbi:MAG: Cysteine desulfurase [Candidatus Nomurabacteria bacterium GW2011_GWF2_43_8]|uniref:Cysteine desulfurase n=3 Tax=Candidatus Nomuraibacteriota TaxID=1752729 RepID=A0A0G1HSE9_9BACT|nr:MAG: Cysteine desulfurase [Candidatus Nomurabacteria bacterium GW2011_GWA2_43_15]KKT19352.1 MAG: Cysteine desulfurase [Candidatus Nomurabacteria bacterium GW2011_GWB1_43_7]KKT22537.1 MAG: Cysteine desulfurase [Candidatus Nomurabacteria bacterium GW2011_GWF2_43_8]